METAFVLKTPVYLVYANFEGHRASALDPQRFITCAKKSPAS